ncbi:MAG TPA: hypothetical protein VF179_19310 [Thermoanaerobaculia bacterium]|nr:hypothetical protein [Thermoanaerobaculia bacterium]
MLSKNTAEPQAAPVRHKAGRAKNPALLDPRSKIEAASQGTGTGNDQGGTDNKPPGIDDLELLAGW